MTIVLYAQIWKNKLIVKNLKDNSEFISEAHFSSKRLLVAEFEPFVECLKAASSRIVKKGLFPEKIHFIMQPMEMNEGGLSGVEKRVLEEAALNEGASKVYIHTDDNNASLSKVIESSGFIVN